MRLSNLAAFDCVCVSLANTPATSVSDTVPRAGVTWWHWQAEERSLQMQCTATRQCRCRSSEVSLQLLLICSTFYKAIQEAVICKETNLWGDRGREVINIGKKEYGVQEQYTGAHRTSRELILNICHRLLLYGFYWSENFESNLELFPNYVVVKFVQEALVGDNVLDLTKI